MAPHSSVLACRIPWTEEPGGLCGVAESDTTERTSVAEKGDEELLVGRWNRSG